MSQASETPSRQILSRTPIDGTVIGYVTVRPREECPDAVAAAQRAFEQWRTVPAPKRGELIRHFGEVLREHKHELGTLISRETGKILPEGLGEVQEMIDICEFAVGLSRQLYGLTIASERPGHVMLEQWHPLGPILVISAFNFPAAVWAWNAALAVVCGNPVIWKPSELAPLTAETCQHLFALAKKRFQGTVPSNLSQVVQGGREHAAALTADSRVRLVSATGSCDMGRAIRRLVADDLGKRCLLELGGNNAMIVAPSADLDLALRAIVFSAVGTAGQRCTTLRRLFVHESVRGKLLPRLVEAYRSLRVGNPLEEGVLVGPLRTQAAYSSFRSAIFNAQREGGRLLVGGTDVLPEMTETFYVRPAIIDMPVQTQGMLQETFAPLLYVMSYADLGEAIALQNAAHHGLSSSIFTNDVREEWQFLSAAGSDCGIANVNIGPSGAEIGGAFGGEKDTGGGRESGTDSWRNYMRRATNTVNHSRELPLAQGITFGE